MAKTPAHSPRHENNPIERTNPGFDESRLNPIAKILLSAELGEIGPEEAEKEAELIGAGPLADGPSYSDGHPETELYWTLPMTLAWLIWRTPEKVSEYSNEFRFRRRIWVEHSPMIPGQLWHDPTRRGWRLQRQTPVSFEDAGAAGKRDFGDERITELRNDLWRRLQQGALAANGVPADRPKSDRVQIPKAAWIDLSPIYQCPGHEDGVCSHLGELRYDDVRIESAALSELWPTGKGDEVKATGTAPGPPFGSIDERVRAIPKVQQHILDIISVLWPDGRIAPRAKVRDKMILASWKPEYGNKPDPRTIRRALEKWTKSDKCGQSSLLWCHRQI